jgi:hypothetical protein
MGEQGMQVAVEKLIGHWKGMGLTLPEGVKENRIWQFEKKYEVVMPADLKEYFLRIDGMRMTLHDCKDKEGFSFWPLSRVKTVREEMERPAGAHINAEGVESFFVFADYFDWSWAYAIDLSGSFYMHNKVFLVGKEQPIKVADSFTGFVDLYVSGSIELYGDANHS